MGLQPGVKSAMRTLDLIEFVVARPSGVVAQEIAVALAIPVSSLSYLLATLVERSYLRRQGRQYFPGEGLNRLRLPPGEHSLIERVRPVLKTLCSQLNETATLFKLVGWEVEAVLTETAGRPLRYSIEVGSRAPLHAVAAGKAILSTMPGEMLDSYFAETRRERCTEHTICERTRLMKDVDLARKSGVAVARNEHTPGITACAVALQQGTDAPMAISIAGPSLRMTPEAETMIAEALRRTARVLCPAIAASD